MGPLDPIVKIAGKAVGVVAGGARVAASLIYSTSEHAKSMVGIAKEREAPAPTDAPVEARAKSAPSTSPTSEPPGPVTAPPAEHESVEVVAEAAVARELAEEPRPTPSPSKAARAVAPQPPPEPVFSTSTPDASQSTPASEEDQDR